MTLKPLLSAFLWLITVPFQPNCSFSRYVFHLPTIGPSQITPSSSSTRTARLTFVFCIAKVSPISAWAIWLKFSKSRSPSISIKTLNCSPLNSLAKIRYASWVMVKGLWNADFCVGRISATKAPIIAPWSVIWVLLSTPLLIVEPYVSYQEW